MAITSIYLWSPSGSTTDLIDLRDVIAWSVVSTDPTLVSIRLLTGFGSTDGFDDLTGNSTQVITATAASFEAAMNAANPTAFKFTVNTARVAPGGSVNVTLTTQFRLPLNPALSGYNFTITWGDGSTDIITNSLAAVPTLVSTDPAPGASTTTGTYTVNAIVYPYVLHTYAVAGVHQIAITENAVAGFPAIAFVDQNATSQAAVKACDAFKIDSLDAWGSGKWTSMIGAFQGANFMTTAGLTDIATANHGSVTSWDRAFTYLKAMTVFPAINFSAATDISSMCNGCSALLAMPFVDTSLVVKANFTWVGCSALTSFPALNLGANLNFTSTWGNCTGLTSFPVVDVHSGTNFTNCWSGDVGLTSFPVLNYAAGITMTGAWNNCSGLTSFPASSFPVATTISGTWNGCTAMATFGACTFPNLTNASTAWQGCTVLASFGVLAFPKVTNFTSTFRSCPALLTIPLFSTTTVTTFTQMFNLSTAFNQDLSDWNVESGLVFTSMFNGATTFKQNLGQWWFRGVTTGLATMFTGVDINTGGSPTNLTLSAQAFDNANWTKTNLTAPANSTTAPDGTVTADSLTPSATNSTNHSVQQTVTVVNATAYTIRVALKADELTWGQLIVTGAITANVYANLSTGAIESSSGSVSVTDIGSGWYVLEITGTATTTSLVVQIKAWNNALGTSFAGNAANNIFAWQCSVFDGGSTATYSAMLNGITGQNNGTTQVLTGITATPTVAAGGTGYTVGDTLSLVGGTNFYDRTASVIVATVGGSGDVLTVTLRRGDGNYITQPSNPVATTGGTGTGCTLTAAWVTKASAIPASKAFGMGTAKYSIKDAAAVNARKFLLVTKTWTITDGGPI